MPPSWSILLMPAPWPRPWGPWWARRSIGWPAALACGLCRGRFGERSVGGDCCSASAYLDCVELLPFVGAAPVMLAPEIGHTIEPLPNLYRGPSLVALSYSFHAGNRSGPPSAGPYPPHLGGWASTSTPGYSACGASRELRRAALARRRVIRLSEPRSPAPLLSALSLARHRLPGYRCPSRGPIPLPT